MSSLSIEHNSDGSESGSDSGTTNHSQISSKPKRIRDQFRAWNFHYTIQTYLLGEEEVSTDEKKLLLTYWHLTSKLVWVIVPLISVPIIGFVQSQNKTVYTMIPWFPDAKWAPVLGGFADHPDFRRTKFSCSHLVVDISQSRASNCTGKPPVSK